MRATVGDSAVLLLVVEWLGVALVLAKVGEHVLALVPWRVDQGDAFFALWMAGKPYIKALA